MGSLDISTGLLVVVQILVICTTPSSSWSLSSGLSSLPTDPSSSSLASVSSSPTQTLDCELRLGETILRRTRVLLALLEEFQDQYAQEKFSNTWDVMDAILSRDVDEEFLRVCDEEDDECTKVLPPLSSATLVLPSSPPSLDKLLNKFLAYTRHYALALELVFLDQSLHEDELVLMEATDRIYRHVQGLVDVVVAQVEQCRLTADDASLRNLTEKFYKGAASDLRDQRGFRTFRHFVHGLRHMRDAIHVHQTNQTTTQ